MNSSLLLYRIVRSLRLLFPFIGHSQPFPALLWQQWLTATRIALLTIAMLTINLLAQAQVTYLNTYTDGKVAGLPTQLIVDNRGNGRANSVPSPLGGTIGFSNELGNSASPSGLSWGYGYSGKVYSNNQVTSITLTLPANTKAFYLLARASYQPNLSGMGGGNITASVTTEKGYTTSGTQRCYFADTEAKYIAFNIDNYVVEKKTYRVCDNPTLRPCYDSTATTSYSNISDYLKTITVTLDFPGATLYIGQFGIYQCENDQFTTRLLASNNGVLTCTNPTMELTAPDVDFFSTGISFTGPNGPVTDNEFIRVSNRVTVSEPGTYTVTADPAAGCRHTGTVTVTEDKALPTNVTLSNDGPLSCKKTSVTLTAGSANGVNYAFSGPNGFSRSGTDITASATTPGNYALVVTGSNGCKATVRTDVGTAPAPPADVTQSLTDLYNATGGTNWTHKDNWLSGCTPCGWYGVTCDGNGQVTKLNLIGNNLSGTLPTSLSVLTSLQSLELGANALTGGIPLGIGSLTALQTLNLSRTQLGGPIPASLGGLTRLQNLLLNESALTGPLPASLGGLSQLQNLQLYTNQLGGCFPASYTALCGRSSISFANNPDLPGGGDFGAFCSNGAGGPLVVSQFPQSGTACVGSAFSFSVVARGATSYQWYKEGQRLAESGPALRFSSVSASDAGTYQVYINYACGAIQSDFVTLTVNQTGTGGCPQANTPPVATANANQTATAGQAFSYTVNAFTDAESPNSLTYSASITPLRGLSFDALTRVVSGSPTSLGASTVTITATDPDGLSAHTAFSITTRCADLTASINPSTATLSCANPTMSLTASGGESYRWEDNSTSALRSVSTGGTYSVTVTTVGGCTASAQITVTGNATAGLMTYYADADGDGFGNANATITACSSTPPTGFVANSTDCDDTRKLYADKDGDGFGAGPAVACGVATNTDCNDTNAAITPTTLTNQPKSLALEEKQDATISVTATGTNLTYQWYFNGTTPAHELKKETSATLILKNAKLSDAGTYYVRVTGVCGSVLSGGAALTVSSKKSRLAAVEPASLGVKVLGNPLVGTQLEVEVTGAEGMPLQLQVIDPGGRVITQQQLEQAGVVEHRRLEVSAQPAGLLLLRVSTPTRSQVVKVVKQ